MKLRVISRALAGSLFFAFVLCFATVARAQMSDGEKKAAARAAYTEGVDLQDKGKPGEALGRFESAQKLFDAPTHLLHIAECQALTGKLVEASETYETLSRKTLPAGSPDAFVQAQEQGKAELAQLRPRIPTLRVAIKPDPTTLQNLQININDKQMPVEAVNIARPVNPGKYKLSAAATGYGTAKPEEIDIQEKDQKSIELTLVSGGTGIVAVPPTGNPNDPKNPPPPVGEQPKPPPDGGPSSTGLLLGIRPAVFVPVGSVQKDRKFKDFASAGPGVGLDVTGRIARLFLVGGTLEIASLGGPDASSIPAGTKAEVSTTSIYIGVLAGILPNVDKVSFIADLGVGERILSHTDTRTIGTTTSKVDDSTYTGFEVALNAGVSIPAGPIRIVPKAGLALGQFTNRSCTVGFPTATGAANPCAAGASTDIADTSFHTILQVALGLYYHVDFSKKSGSKASLPTFIAQGSRP